MIIDPLYLIVLAPGLALAFWAQWKVRSSYAKAQEVPASLSGADAARRMLDREGLHDVGIEVTHGFLSDHYDPRHKVLRLSPEVYKNRSLAAVGIAAHEAGHALQDAHAYAPLVVRSAAVPLAAFGGNTAMFVFIGGLLFGGLSTVVGAWLLLAGIVLFSAVVFFQLVNLPVELNASSRAKTALGEMAIVSSPQQAALVNEVLRAAAMTYVAATISAILTLLYMLLRSGLLGRRD